MVDNRDNIRLFQTGNGLALLVVINQHNALAPRPQQMIAAQRADDLLVLVQHGIGAVAALQHRLAHVVDEVVEVKQHDPRMLGNALHRNRLINHPCRAVSVAGRGDNARLAGQTEVLFRQRALADNDTRCADFQRLVHHVLLLPADDDAAAVDALQAFAGCRQSNHDFAGNGVERILLVVDDMPFERGQKVENRHVTDFGLRDALHVLFGNAARGQHPVERAILVRDRHCRQIFILAQHCPRVADRNTCAERWRTVVVNIAHLCADIGEQRRRLKAEAVEQELRLVVRCALHGGDIGIVAQRIMQRRKRHGGHHGIGIRIAVSADINRIHLCILLSRGKAVVKSTFYPYQSKSSSSSLSSTTPAQALGSV